MFFKETRVSLAIHLNFLPPAFSTVSLQIVGDSPPPPSLDISIDNFLSMAIRQSGLALGLTIIEEMDTFEI